MPDNTSTQTPLWSDLQQRFQAKRAATASRRALAQDLEQYNSPSEIAEWDAILGRHHEDEAADIRRILDHQRCA
jgi:hypothetical protein